MSPRLPWCVARWSAGSSRAPRNGKTPRASSGQSSSRAQTTADPNVCHKHRAIKLIVSLLLSCNCHSFTILSTSMQTNVSFVSSKCQTCDCARVNLLSTTRDHVCLTTRACKELEMKITTETNTHKKKQEIVKLLLLFCLK